MRIRELTIALSLIIFSLALVSGDASAQKMGRQIKREPARIDMPLPSGIAISALNQTSAEIKKIRPGIPDTTLKADAEIIQNTLPQIVSQFSKIGLTFDDAVWASQKGWMIARLNSPLRLTPEKPIDSNSFVDYVTGDVSAKIVRWQIQNENPDIDATVLTKDMQLIDRAQPNIVAAYQKLGWTATDARGASLMAWKRARLESPLGRSEPIDFQSLVESTTEMGIMVFTSEPDQAEVFINSVKIGTTNKQKNEPLRFFVDGQKVNVRFVKADFLPQDLDCVAKGQDTVICNAELKHQQ